MTTNKELRKYRAWIGQALEVTYIEASELEDVIDNVMVMLAEAWDACVDYSPHTTHERLRLKAENPYKESE